MKISQPRPPCTSTGARVAIQVWHEGQLVVRSTNAPTQPLADLGVMGLSVHRAAGDAWRVFSAPGYEPDVVVQVGELESARRHICWPA